MTDRLVSLQDPHTDRGSVPVRPTIVSLSEGSAHVYGRISLAGLCACMRPSALGLRTLRWPRTLHLPPQGPSRQFSPAVADLSIGHPLATCGPRPARTPAPAPSPRDMTAA